MLGTNRGGIKDAIKEWSQRKNIPDGVLNDFIELALSRASRALRIPPLEGYQELTVAANGYVDIPFDYIEGKELTIQVSNRTVILARKDISEVDHQFNNKGHPYIFGRIGSQFKIAPQLDEGTIVGLYYNKIIPAMTDDTQENWFTQYAPEVLLYGGLQELSDYTRDGEGAQAWKAKFNEAINIIQAVEDRAMWSGSTLSISLAGSRNP